jgi:uncharacterized membrane protein YraQ (UPF0718 family)
MVVVLMGIGTLVLLLWEPQIEGRNAHATLYQIYFNDPFLAYAYIASIAFFVALYQTFTARSINFKKVMKLRLLAIFFGVVSLEIILIGYSFNLIL